MARVAAGEGEGAEGGLVGEGRRVVGEGGGRAVREVSGWWAVHLSSWASPAGPLVGARRVGARLVAGGIVGGIASQSCWRLRGEPRAVDSLAVDRRTHLARGGASGQVQQTIRGGYPCGVGSPPLCSCTCDAG